MQTKTDTDPKNITWEQLLESISHGKEHAEETKWLIFRYLQHNYKTIGSVIVRTLLAAYMKLHVKEASLINSCMLGMAAKISETYSDFKLTNFLDAWGYDSCLRAQDLQRKTGKDGRQFLSLKERVERALQSYLLHHPDENKEGCKSIVSMYAVKVFEKDVRGRKCRYVKLVGSDGMDFIADSHQFPCRPWEICGHMFDVLTRLSKQGKERAADIVVSQKRIDEVFTPVVGYVEHVDESHGHIHVYDSLSRHFVAEMKAIPHGIHIEKGCFVRFCPIIIKDDTFKSAAIIGTMDKQEGYRLFGVYEATIDYVNTADCYVRYTIKSGIKTTPEGTIAPTGFASTADMSQESRNRIAAGDHVQILLFLKRGKDGLKHNYVAEIIT